MQWGTKSRNGQRHISMKRNILKGIQARNGCSSGKTFWPETDGVRIEPPMFKKMPGRPKKNRRKDKDEPRKVKDNKLLRE
ncbi:hypothetical protein Scep_013490 [Stephania cephalantha]|uniref:Uncharacterized protein n=1 Tax=Stephania cephalantha TaxID=152367 RepID=A0AAP0JHG0_9MAGN